jgi:hypothetical protein
VKIVSEAKGSDFFSLGAPAMVKTDKGQHVGGRVCRLGRTTLLSPPRIRVEHLLAAGRVAEVAHAYVPSIYRATDQTCSDYGANVAWIMSEGDVVRACFDRGAACPANAESKAIVKAPATP